MRVDDLGSLGQKRNLLHDLVAVVAMLLHDGHLVGLEFARLVQNLVRNGHLPDVVQERSARDRVDLFAGQAHGAGNRNGESGHSLGVAFGLAVFQIQRIAQSFQRDVIGPLQIATSPLAIDRCGPSPETPDSSDRSGSRLSAGGFPARG